MPPRKRKTKIASKDSGDTATCSDLLLGLPEIAAQCVVKQLLSAGSTKIAELFTLCKTTRRMVLQHAEGATYTPGSSTRHSGLHDFASRDVPATLSIDLDGTSEEQLASILLDAASCRNGRGWSVNQLELHGTEESLEWKWGHLLGRACPHLKSLQLSSLPMEPSFLLSLASCKQLTHLELSADVQLAAAAARDIAMLQAAAPLLTSLSIRAEEHAPVLHALAPQLTKLQLWGKYDAPDREAGVEADWALPIVAACSNLTTLELGLFLDEGWYDVACKLPKLDNLAVFGSVDVGDALQPAQPWESLKANLLSFNAVEHLPLAHIRQLHVVTLHAHLGTLLEVASGAAALRAVTAPRGGQAGGASLEFTWGGGLMLQRDDDGIGAEVVAGCLRTCLDALAAAGGTWEALEICLSDHEPQVVYRFGAADVSAVRDTMGHSLKKLRWFADKGQLDPLFWGAVLQLPVLQELSVCSLAGLDSTALATAAVAASRPLTVLITPHSSAASSVRQAVDDAGDMLRRQQVNSLMTIACLDD